MEQWYCKKCGHCCKYQQKPMDIWSNEMEYFPRKKFKPFLGWGDNKSDIWILLYRLIPKRCPMYDKDIGCTIYKNRPLVCKRFPVGPDPTNPIGLGFDVSCRNVESGNTLKSVSEEFIQSILSILKQNDKQFDYIKEKLETSNLWIFKKFKWKLLTKEKIERMFKITI